MQNSKKSKGHPNQLLFPMKFSDSFFELISEEAGHATDTGDGVARFDDEELAKTGQEALRFNFEPKGPINAQNVEEGTFDEEVVECNSVDQIKV